MQWVLIILVHVGTFKTGNSNAITSAYFASKELCEQARAEVKKLTSGSVKEMEATCVRSK